MIDEICFRIIKDFLLGRTFKDFNCDKAWKLDIKKDA